MPDAIPLASRIVGYRVYHAARVAAAGLRGDYKNLADTGTLLPLSVNAQLAPEITRATVELDIAALRIPPWEWRGHVEPDDFIAFISDHADPADRHIPFYGFVVDTDYTFDRRGQCILNAAGPAWRLRRDTTVFGRWMRGHDEGLWHYSALPCAFNAGGRPNAYPVLQSTEDLGWERRPVIDHTRALRTGLPVFTYDGDPDAVWWTASDIFEYLCWFYNPLEAWVRNADLASSDYARDDPVVVGCEGLDLWTALAAVADRAGYDVAEWISADAAGEPSCQMAIIRKHAGTPTVVTHQPPNPDGTWQGLDLAKTDLFTATIAEATSSCVTRPVVAGGAELYEITVPLSQAWDPALLATPAEPGIILPKNTKAQEFSEYCQKYTTGGLLFPGYAEVGRLWDANTDGRYSAAPYGLAVPDVAALADHEAGCWPEMPYRAMPLLTRMPRDGAPSLQPLLEINWGSGWEPCPAGWRLLPGRLGIWFSIPNLTAIARSPTEGTLLDVTDTLFWRLLDDPAKVELRLTCTVGGPDRNMAVPARRASAGTAFAAQGWFDRAAAGQIRTRCTSSALAGSGVAADTADGTADLAKVAAAIQDAAEDRLVEASLSIEWIADARLTDLVTRIRGIEVDLAVNAGPAKRYPRVVGVNMNFTPDTYSMALRLSTQRKAGVV